MSNIGKQLIKLPDNIEVSIKNTEIYIKGKLGDLSLAYDPRITVISQDGYIKVSRATDKRKDRELHGLYRALINNMVEGVSNGFEKELHLVGVGYTADKKGDFLLINVGFSHPIYFEIPSQITIEVSNPTTILIKGFDKQNVGDMAAKIRSVRKPEPYKGKGIKYSDEFIRRKAGKVVGG